MRTAIIITPIGPLASTANAETRLLGFPDLHGDTVVFTCAGELPPQLAGPVKTAGAATP